MEIIENATFKPKISMASKKIIFEKGEGELSLDERCRRMSEAVRDKNHNYIPITIRIETKKIIPSQKGVKKKGAKGQTERKRLLLIL